ncbi:acetyl-CoA carboxylase carboxyltransferase subunit alpha [Candidatus Nucleicultrix amoebiphila]|jgi:acetyl-CoA carboxylase carboxyl transferase subunit alpha|uniref:Acetyl-coenzyme A carboxylase carboxyl transferase subunit alpha n=1 Tax=Candidatus Nucleicultrix amoebiphila FS5 TaxID=1414854 RepID=A0A1W6N653_9PROT|nr:acetyl-CoA carboxylase carboxyltransferase subunit alpha [Candidatus Nucleicultrix amoebiphila]ARN85278.1 acetyl-CoA carboxylase subunit alpha [Candidatus Nucleicultrix amoebiphila FS5]
MAHALEFEQPIIELENKLDELRHLSNKRDVNITEEISRLEKKVQKLLKETYESLSPWQKVLVARHGERPQFLDFVGELIEDFTELSGDRRYGEDKALIGGLGRFRGYPVMIMGHQKGNNLESRLRHNFGMPKPEGYRKAQRLMDLAEKFSLPILTFVDTAGAHPGIDAEERGQSEAIASSIERLLEIKTPVVSIVTGEGGSGGAIAIAVANVVLMMEHAVYSVISPEGCASILWRTAEKKELAAAAQKLTAQDLLKLGVIDRIVTEPLGGAHRSAKAAIAMVGDALELSLKQLSKLSGDEALQQRRRKFLQMGQKEL